MLIYAASIEGTHNDHSQKLQEWVTYICIITWANVDIYC